MSDKIISLRGRLIESEEPGDYVKSFQYGSEVDRVIGKFLLELRNLSNDYVTLTLTEDPETGAVGFDSDTARDFTDKLKSVFDSFIETCEEEIAAGGFKPPTP